MFGFCNGKIILFTEINNSKRGYPTFWTAPFVFLSTCRFPSYAGADVALFRMMGDTSRNALIFLAQSMQPKEQVAHAMKTIPVVTIVSPNPTKGDTSPPNPKPTALDKAEAVPACSRSHSIAKAVVEVKEKPIMNSKMISNPS